MSPDQLLTRTSRAAKLTLAKRWKQLCYRFGVPPEHSPLSSLHYLLTEYIEPLPTVPVAPYKSDPGSVDVEQQTLALPLAKGSRQVSLTITYPTASEGPLPCLVLSPGLGAHRNANRYFETHLASHGYAVVRARHPGSDFLATAFRTPLGAFTLAEFSQRVAELERALEAAFGGELPVPIDPEKIALGGHSFGALTSCLMAGLRSQSVSPKRYYPLKALVALSPYGDSFPARRLGIDVDSYNSITLPVLFMSGTRDELFTFGKGHKTHLEPFRLVGSTEKHHVVIGKTRHGSFSELFGWVRKETRVMVNSTLTAFLDTHLKEDEHSRSYLRQELAQAAFEFSSWAL